MCDRRLPGFTSKNWPGTTITLREVRDRLLRMMTEERDQMDRWLAMAIDLAQSGLSLPPDPNVLVDGTTGVLSHPEFTNITRVRRMFETFADKARLVKMLNQCIQGRGVRVVIGEDNDLTSELDFSLVATSYEVAGQSLGTLGILGPTRMQYHKIIPLVDFLGETLSRALAESFVGFADKR
mgnify:CR=1 FL=1